MSGYRIVEDEEITGNHYHIGQLWIDNIREPAIKQRHHGTAKISYNKE
jgi:hypothetical protein